MNPGITYSLYFEEWQACIAAGLDPARWEGEGPEEPYSVDLKARAMAWYRLHRLVESHVDEEVAKKAERLTKGR